MSKTTPYDGTVNAAVEALANAMLRHFENVLADHVERLQCAGYPPKDIDDFKARAKANFDRIFAETLKQHAISLQKRLPWRQQPAAGDLGPPAATGQ
ncbi:hypothetical protein [Dongia deserti]|uniref:hypothetical protein n=1 Tax=Dongia deserti TaxID=2268030 RepID=UPI000E64775A|nr:hypothetical protein [Dongia deserti]